MTKFVRDTQRIYVDDLEGSVDDVIETLKTLKAEAEERGWTNIRLNFDTYPDDGTEAYIRGQRPETAEETAVREFKEAHAAKQQREADLKELQRLQSLYKAES